MAPQSSKTSFKSYEVQARLLRAIVAAHQEVKWNYKEKKTIREDPAFSHTYGSKAITVHYGQDASICSIRNRFNYLRTQAEIIRLGLDADLDPQHMCIADSSLPRYQTGIDRKNIARYFGESTTDGIQYQFRSIKRDATAMRTAVDINESPIAAIADSLVATSGNGSSSGARRRVPKAAGKAKLEAPNIKRDEASDGDEITKRDRDGESDGNDESRLGPLVTSSWLPLKRKRTGDTGVAGEVGSRAPAIDLVDYTEDEENDDVDEEEEGGDVVRTPKREPETECTFDLGDDVLGFPHYGGFCKSVGGRQSGCDMPWQEPDEDGAI
ncbi:hypothetical protein CFIMG_008288RA00001 [Ceratocystis fimbriata CBS 114723]|uniref:Uncharacterized protein n=1 Tax=Ceratocystis fimbriata CBS 114723 TaxID=1035309 RepID=A0A2C5X5B9_9PEZI|nr:hypothetical protein CFIMG_008288RA00001 [Ceratocystis fimbriata CBS 114723]